VEHSKDFKTHAVARFQGAVVYHALSCVMSVIPKILATASDLRVG
jgi:hypothetical protein